MTLKDFYTFIERHRAKYDEAPIEGDLIEEQRVRLHCEKYSALDRILENTFVDALAWFVDKRHPERIASLTPENVRARFVSRYQARLRWIDDHYRPRRKFTPRTRKPRSVTPTTHTDGTLTRDELVKWMETDGRRVQYTVEVDAQDMAMSAVSDAVVNILERLNRGEPVVIRHMMTYFTSIVIRASERWFASKRTTLSWDEVEARTDARDRDDDNGAYLYTLLDGGDGTPLDVVTMLKKTETKFTETATKDDGPSPREATRAHFKCSPEEYLLRQEDERHRDQRIEDALSVLTMVERVVFLRVVVDEDTHRIIAHDMGVSRQIVTKLMLSARRKILDYVKNMVACQRYPETVIKQSG